MGDHQSLKNLWSAVLKQAIIDLDIAYHRKGTIDWFKSQSEEVNSFVGICRTLEMDPDIARKKILAKAGIS